MELEDEISSLDNEIKAHQSKLRHVEDERAMLEKERVSGIYFYLLITLLCLFSGSFVSKRM